jgi:hypothetical protein
LIKPPRRGADVEHDVLTLRGYLAIGFSALTTICSLSVLISTFTAGSSSNSSPWDIVVTLMFLLLAPLIIATIVIDIIGGRRGNANNTAALIGGFAVLAPGLFVGILVLGSTLMQGPI